MISALLMVDRPNANPDRGWFPARPTLNEVLGELGQTTRGEWISHPPTDAMPQCNVATLCGRQRLSGRSLRPLAPADPRWWRTGPGRGRTGRAPTATTARTRTARPAAPS